MDNIISSALTPGMSLPPAESGVSGTVAEVPPTLNQLQTGDSLLLKTLVETEAFKLNTKLAVNVLTAEGDVPLVIHLDRPLPPPIDTSSPHQFEARVTGRPGGQLTLQITGADRQKTVPVQNNTATTSTAPAVVSTKPAPMNMTLLPLKSSAVLEQLMTELDFPADLRQSVLKQLPPQQLQVKVISPQPTTEFPNVKETLASMRQILSTAIKQADPQSMLGEVSAKLTALKGQILPAITATDGNLTRLTTPLGNILPQTPIKLPSQIPLQLLVTDIGPAPDAAPELPPLLSALSKLVSALPEAPDQTRLLHHLLRNENLSPSLKPLLKIISPLPSPPTPERADLTARFLDKIPMAGPKLLANLHGFYKAATSGDISGWLGKKLTADLTQSGPEGREILNRAGDFMTANTRDGVSWRIVEMPFFDGSNLARIKLAVKKNQDQEDENNPASKPAKGGIRFLVETEFSRLGSFQFDGFSLASDRRFDLVIRTSRPMATDFVANIMAMFKTSLNEVGYLGNIQINMQESFVRIHENDPNQLPGGIYI